MTDKPKTPRPEPMPPLPTEAPEGVSPVWYIVLGLLVLAVLFAALSLAAGA